MTDDIAAHGVCTALLDQAAESDAVMEGVLRAAVGILVAQAFCGAAKDPGAELDALLGDFATEVREAFGATLGNVVPLPVGGRLG